MLQEMKLFKEQSVPSDGTVTLYHGSVAENLVPAYGKGLVQNDYGVGFYLTTDFEMAKEWACGRYTHSKRAFVYEYQLNLEGLSVFDFRSIKKNAAVTWVTELLQHRTLDGLDEDSFQVRDFLIRRFGTNAVEHDVIIGYRADDSYFSFAARLVNGGLGISRLTNCLEAGKLGVKYCLKSKKAFDALRQVAVHSLQGSVYEEYNSKYIQRDRSARSEVSEILKLSISNIKNEITVYDLMRKE